MQLYLQDLRKETKPFIFYIINICSYRKTENNWHGCEQAFVKILFKIVLLPLLTLGSQFIIFKDTSSGADHIAILYAKMYHSI